METFGEWLKSELDKKNISQKKLADLSGVTPAQISRIISGSRGAGDQALTAIAHALNLPPETVFIAAGIYKPTYDPQNDKDPTLLEWIKLFKDADNTKREEMLRYARYMSNEGEKSTKPKFKAR